VVVVKEKLNFWSGDRGMHQLQQKMTVV